MYVKTIGKLTFTRRKFQLTLDYDRKHGIAFDCIKTYNYFPFGMIAPKQLKLSFSILFKKITYCISFIVGKDNTAPKKDPYTL